jgi:hypothetical protein
VPCGEFYVRSTTIAKCHPVQDAADRTYLAKADVLQCAALKNSGRKSTQSIPAITERTA